MFLFLIVSTGQLPIPVADLVARRIRARARRRKTSAATVHRRTRNAAGVAAPRAKRSSKRGRRARRTNPGLDLALSPGPALDREWKIAQGDQSPRAASSPRATTREASPRGALALAPVPARPPTPNPEPALNLSPSPNPAPPHPPKPAPTPALPPVQSPAPNPAPRLVLAPALAPSSDFIVSPPSPIYIPPTPRHYPCLPFLINSCRTPGTHSRCCPFMLMLLHFIWLLLNIIFPPVLCCMEVFVK